jgi:tetratricopeptide (TPR) repeat protein
MIYRVRGELDKALVSINNSLEIALKLNSPDKIANSYYELGLIFTKEGKLEEARNAFQKSLEVFEKLKAEWRLPYVQLKLREVEVLLETGKKE